MQVIYHFPYIDHLRRMFLRPDLGEFLLQDTGDRPPGHFSHSRGWNLKVESLSAYHFVNPHHCTPLSCVSNDASLNVHGQVRDNPHMSDDNRNQSLIATCDGVPYFDDQRRGAWLFVFRHGNLPDALSMRTSNVYMPILSANEHWELDEDANVLRRHIRGPKSLLPHLTIIADDMVGAYSGTLSERGQ